VIVLMGVVAVLVAGVGWMIVTGKDPSQEEPNGSSPGSRAIGSSGSESGSGSSEGDGGPIELTATENAQGVQLDWEESGSGRQLVLVLSVTEAPRALPAETGTALLVSTSSLLPQTGYCFAVVPAEEATDAPTLASRLPSSALPPSACIRGATAATIRKE
jgi:hypothetical protein